MLHAVAPSESITWEPATMVTKMHHQESAKNTLWKSKTLPFLDRAGPLTGACNLEYVVAFARQVHSALEDHFAVEVVDARVECESRNISEPGAFVGCVEGLGLSVRRREVGVGIDGACGARAYVLDSIDDSRRESCRGCSF